jgi:hypothetical protein
MKQQTILGAAATALLLSACAATTTTPAPTTTATTSGTKFCHESRLYPAGNDLVCNWANTAAEACQERTLSSKLASAATAAAPTRANRCSTGEWLVQVTMR